MKTDYPELEGKIIIMHFVGDSFKAYVVGCSYHVGITLVANEKRSHIVCCINRKLFSSKSTYRKYFQRIVKAIIKGTLDPYLIEDNVKFSPHKIPKSACAFS